MEGRLTFASYVKCLEAAMQKPYNQDFELTQLLLEFLIFKGTVYVARGKKGNAVDVDKTMVSNLLNNRENVHSSIQDNCDLDTAINGIEEYFDKEILPVISPHMRDDMMENMVRLIKADAGISRAKENAFLKMAEEERISGFLSSVFLYVVKRENKIEKQRMESKEEGPWDTNKQYYNSFVENLFLHRGEGSKTVRLKDLFVLPRYKEMHRFSKKIIGADVVDFISKFSIHVIEKERHQGQILFIEGDAGVGKTSLVSYLSYLYIEKTEEWERLFQDKTLLCIRLRDIIPPGMKFSSDTIVKDILGYLNIECIEDFSKIYKNPLIVLDGFDELCMVENINVNAAYYIYQIFQAFRNYKIIITTRPQYLDVQRLDVKKQHIVLQHFDALQRRRWVENYQKTGILECEKIGIDYLLDETNEEIDSICDTPMVMYMIAAGGINEEARHNIWVLYHQIFYKELSDTEYNSMFPNCTGIYSHNIGKYREQLYRLSAEIAYEMFRSKNTKLFSSSKEISDIVNKLQIEDIKLRDIVQHCYALCNYWKSNGKGAVEFYHNNIRDFFLCEKIFYEFNFIYRECESLKMQEVVTYFIELIYGLFRYMKFPDKVIEFLYLRVKYNHEHQNMMDFPSEEYKRKYLPYFFSDILQYGGVSHYDRDSGENVYDNMRTVLTNTVRIFRVILEPYLMKNERIKWYEDADCVNRADILRHNFGNIFIFNLVIDNYKKISFTGKADFKKLNLEGTKLSGVDLSGADLRGANLNRVNLRNANLSGADLSGLDLRNVDLKGADLQAAYLSSAKLNHVDFSNMNLKDADLGDADMNDAKLIHTDLGGAYLRHANLKDVNLKGANLRKAVLPDGFQSEDQKTQLKHLREMNIPGLLIDSFE